MEVHFGKNKGSELALREALVFVERLTRFERQPRSGPRRTRECIHLAQCPRHLGPNGVNVIVQGPQREDLQLWLFVGQEAQDSRC